MLQSGGEGAKRELAKTCLPPGKISSPKGPGHMTGHIEDLAPYTLVVPRRNHHFPTEAPELQ